MRKMYNSLVSMFVKGWGKLFGEVKNTLEHTPLLLEYEEDPYTCELKEGDIVELLPQNDWCYWDKMVGGWFKIGFCRTGDGSFGVMGVHGLVTASCNFYTEGEGRGSFNRSRWKKVLNGIRIS